MLLLPISRPWIVSRRARRVYLVCAILSLALSGTLMGTSAAQGAMRTNRLPETTGSVLGVVMIPEVLGTALLWAGMLYFWFGFDQSHWLSRSLWFVCLMLFLPFFWALYYFLVYRGRSGEYSQMPSPAVASDG